MRVGRSAFWFVLSGLLGSLQAQPAPFNCFPNTGVPPIVRAEGTAEQVSDFVVNCFGGTPTPAGQPLPQFTFTLFFDSTVTGKLTAGNQFNEALLIVDEPASLQNPARPILNCGNVGAPDNGPSGAGVCSIVSTGDPTASYDGVPNGYGTASCDGSAGRPLPNSYGCGRPNVFQGRLGTPQSPTQLNAVTFLNVPLDPPGPNSGRVLRITNVRVNISAMALSAATAAKFVNALVLAAGPVPIGISNPEQRAAFVEAGLVFSGSSCQPSVSSRLRICEGFACAWRPKNISFAVGNGVSGNATLGQFYWVYNGAANYPPDVAQNVPGAIYNSEAGFQWQNNGANGPPSPNPPPGISSATVTATASPLASSAFGGIETGISTAGVANQGTRIAVRFTNIPADANVQVPQTLYLFKSSYNGDPTQYQAGATGVMVLTSTDSAGAGPFSPGSGTLNSVNNLAVYEILWADPFSVEFTEIPYTLTNAPQGTTLQTTIGYAPFYSDSAAVQPSITRPVPRFLDGANVCGGQSCLNASPDQGVNSGTVLITFTDYAGRDLTAAQVLLRAPGVPDIVGTNSSNSATNVLAASFNLASAPAGARDVIINPVTGPAIVLAGGFAVMQTPACAYSVSPQQIYAGGSGGTGSIVIAATPPSCAWTAGTPVSWIALPPASTALSMAQPYSIAANASNTGRSAYITVAGQSILVQQGAAGTCGPGVLITPNNTVFPTAGGTVTINVTAPSGCSWTAVSNANWITLTSGASGSGNGSVMIQAGSNAGGPLYGSVTIAGQTLKVQQSGLACGATDVSSQVTVARRAMLGRLGAGYTQQFQLTNSGPAVSGPVYLVLDGICIIGFNCPLLNYQRTTCFPTAGSFSPMAAVAPNGLASGQTLYYNQVYYASPYYFPMGGLGMALESSVTTRVLSGAPSQ